MSGTIVVLGTGGTIAGVSTTGDDRHYQAAQLSVEQLVAAVPALSSLPIEAHQVAQVDSKDMGWQVWRDLLQALVHHLARPEVAGVVVTHGTDTLEETAVLLHLLLPPGKPVVLTAAMRPASSREADGPANVLDAVRVLQWASAHGQSGVVAVMAGRVWAGAEVRKAHSWHIDAFDGGDAAPLAWLESAQVCADGRDWPRPRAWGMDAGQHLLPRVELLVSHGDVDGSVVDALLASAAPGRPLAGLVVACTGHGTVHVQLQAALERARAAGVVVWRSTRVARGGVQPSVSPEAWPAIPQLTAAQARLALSLALWRRPDVARAPDDDWL